MIFFQKLLCYVVAAVQIVAFFFTVATTLMLAVLIFAPDFLSYKSSQVIIFWLTSAVGYLLMRDITRDW